MIDPSLKHRILVALTRPFISFCVRRSYSLQDVLAAIKVNFVDLAKSQTVLPNGRSNISRISVITGVHRADVTRILKEREAPGGDRLSVAQKVIGKWRHHKKFCVRPNKPRVLTYDKAGSEFYSLVESITTTVHPAAVLSELLRQGFVEEAPRGLRLKLQFESLGSAPEEGFQLLSKDLDSLIKAAEENVVESPAVSQLHVRTEYDNLVLKELGAIRIWLRDEGKAFHRRVREYLSRFDKDLTDGLEKEQGGGRVAVGAFSYIDPVDGPPSDSPQA